MSSPIALSVRLLYVVSLNIIRFGEHIIWLFSNSILVVKFEIGKNFTHLFSEVTLLYVLHATMVTLCVDGLIYCVYILTGKTKTFTILNFTMQPQWAVFDACSKTRKMCGHTDRRRVRCMCVLFIRLKDRHKTSSGRIFITVYISLSCCWQPCSWIQARNALYKDTCNSSLGNCDIE